MTINKPLVGYSILPPTCLVSHDAKVTYLTGVDFRMTCQPKTCQAVPEPITCLSISRGVLNICTHIHYRSGLSLSQHRYSNSSTMRLPRHSLSSLPSILLLIPSLTYSLIICDQLKVDDKMFNLAKLDPPHSVMTSRPLSDTSSDLFNTTYTIRFCQQLRKQKGASEDCPNGTRGNGSLFRNSNLCVRNH